MARIYRNGYGVYAANGILFNHESPRRGETFLTRKVTRGVASILAGKEDALYLGNLEARRDWGYTPEYVEAMWREFVEEAFTYASLDWQKQVKISDRYKRPLEVDVLIANPTKARVMLGWQAQIGFRDLVAIMVDADLEAAGLKPRGRGQAVLAEKLGHWNQWHNSVTRVMQATAGQAAQD